MSNLVRGLLTYVVYYWVFILIIWPSRIWNIKANTHSHPANPIQRKDPPPLFFWWLTPLGFCPDGEYPTGATHNINYCVNLPKWTPSSTVKHFASSSNCHKHLISYPIQQHGFEKFCFSDAILTSERIFPPQNPHETTLLQNILTTPIERLDC